MPGHLWEFLLCHLVFSPSSLECILAALGCLSPSPSSLIVLASLKTPSENTCSRFTSVLLVLKMEWKQLCPDGSNDACQKEKESIQRSLCQKDTTTDHTKIKRHSICTFGGDAIFWWPSWSFFSLLLRMNFPCKTSLCLSYVGFFVHSSPFPFASPPSSSAWYL